MNYVVHCESRETHTLAPRKTTRLGPTRLDDLAVTGNPRSIRGASMLPASLQPRVWLVCRLPQILVPQIPPDRAECKGVWCSVVLCLSLDDNRRETVLLCAEATR